MYPWGKYLPSVTVYVGRPIELVECVRIIELEHLHTVMKTQAFVICNKDALNLHKLLLSPVVGSWLLVCSLQKWSTPQTKTQYNIVRQSLYIHTVADGHVVFESQGHLAVHLGSLVPELQGHHKTYTHTASVCMSLDTLLEKKFRGRSQIYFSNGNSGKKLFPHVSLSKEAYAAKLMWQLHNMYYWLRMVVKSMNWFLKAW